MSTRNQSFSFLNHLLELRARISIYFFVLIAASAICFYFNSYILRILLLPINQKLFYTSPAGGLDFIIKIALFGGFILSLPVFLYQILKFVEPALPVNANLTIGVFLISSIILTGLGLSFAYFVSLPSALYFLTSFGSDQIEALITANEYFSFVTRYLLGFAIFFQLPLILLSINKFYRLKTFSLSKAQRWVITGGFIIAAILTPTPDLVNQGLMALPLIIIYYLSIVVIWFVNKFIDTTPDA
jgi:sec-independent protein translocase protein TatC